MGYVPPPPPRRVPRIRTTIAIQIPPRAKIEKDVVRSLQRFVISNPPPWWRFRARRRWRRRGPVGFV